MNGNSIKLIENYCRTCMNGDDEDNKVMQSKHFNPVSIFNEAEIVECKNKTIMELLLLTTPQLKIDSNDMLPKILCENCHERLLNAYKFQRMCIRVEHKLREIIKETPAELQDNKDPLKNISMGNTAILNDINDISQILKIEVDEPLIDQNEISSNNKDVTEDIKFDIENIGWKDVSESEDFGDVLTDGDSEWEIPLNNKKSKKGHKSLKDETIEHTEQTVQIIGDIKKSAKIANEAKNCENKNFECDECGNRLSTRKSLKRHKRIHLRTSEIGKKNDLVKTKYECEFCKKVFQQSSSLKDHLRTHTGEQPYLCSECGKAFKSLSNMKQHFMRHGTDRPYVCPDCPKRFPCLSDLASHKAVHNKTKTHVCDICGAAFVKPYLLKKHKMYHTGEKNHKCDYCDMRFVLADQCRRHMRTHTGEKPYKCKYCERAFAQSNDLIKHLRGHLGDNVYKCNLCPQGFRLQGDLRAHFNTHKNDDEETKVRNLQALKDEEHRLQMKFGLIKCM